MLKIALMKNQFSLLATRRFAPLFITQCLGAFNDNLFKALLVTMVAYGLWDSGAMEPKILVTLASGLFILPFILCAPLGGVLCERYCIARVICWVKLAEIVLALIAAAGLFTGQVYFLLFVLFALGVQSAIFGPAKLSILPRHLARRELIAGNALANTGTYLFILAGTIIGSLLGGGYAGLPYGGALLIVCAMAGYLASRYIPDAHSKAAQAKPTRYLSSFVRTIKAMGAEGRAVFAALVGVAWFYFLGATFLAQFPNYTSFILGVDHITMTFFMAVFSIGIGLGGLLNNRLLGGDISPRLLPWAALVIALPGVDLLFASQAFASSEGAELLDFARFIVMPAGWRVIADLGLIAMAGGLYVVPLNAFIQHRVPDQNRPRMLAANTMLNAVFILASALVAMALFAAGFSVVELFAFVGVLTLPLALVVRYALKDER